MPNIAESLKKAASALDSAKIDSPRREAVSLLCFALGRERAFLIAHPEYKLSLDEASSFGSIVRRRTRREPYHHITGVKEFYGLDFIVSPDVLIPRPETEMLVENSIDLMRKKAEPFFCEVGVGSGCVAVSILDALPRSSAVGLEISKAAIEIASENSVMHGVSDRFEIRHSDIFSALKSEKFDLIVSNPPYIPADDLKSLQPEVKDFEPRIALTDGGDGLSIIKTIVRQSPKFLRSGGNLLIEIGIGQAENVLAFIDERWWKKVEILDDFREIPRMVYAEKRSFRLKPAQKYPRN